MPNKEGRHKKGIKNGDKRNSGRYSQDQSVDDMSSFKNSDSYQNDGHDNICDKEQTNQINSQTSTSDKSDCFSDSRVEKSFKKFLRVLLFAHRREALILNLNKCIDEQFKKSYILDNKAIVKHPEMELLPNSNKGNENS